MQVLLLVAVVVASLGASLLSAAGILSLFFRLMTRMRRSTVE